MMVIEHLTELMIGLVAVMTACAYLYAQRSVQLLEHEISLQSEKIERMQLDFGALLSCSRTIGTRIKDAERTEHQLQKQIDELTLERQGDRVSVEHAMKLLASGHQMSEVTEICELTEGEVEILANQNQFDPATDDSISATPYNSRPQ